MKDREGTTHGLCPFCRRRLSVNWQTGDLFHKMPMCRDFERRTADQFVKAVLEGAHRGAS